MNYAVSVAAAVLDAYASASKRDRLELRKAIGKLSEDPYLPGDTRVRSKTGREHQIKRFGPWLITYWPDHAVSEIRVMDTERFAR